MRARSRGGTQTGFSTWRRLGGVSLLEVLVALVIISIGVLSAVSLHLLSKRGNFDAAQRLEATHMAYSLIERMRANSSREALSAYVTTAAAGLGGGRLGGKPGPSCSDDVLACYPGAAPCPCGAVEAARFDLWLWERLLDGAAEQAGAADAGGLMMPTACIAPPCPGCEGQAGLYTITIAYRGSVALGDDVAVSCGSGAVRDGQPIYGADNAFRRTITVQAFIAPVVEK